MISTRSRCRKPTAIEREAAQAGSMFGWDCPGADPLNYLMDFELLEGG
jgi:hypothetical protein